jgi:hypothetical protein
VQYTQWQSDLPGAACQCHGRARIQVGVDTVGRRRRRPTRSPPATGTDESRVRDQNLLRLLVILPPRALRDRHGDSAVTVTAAAASAYRTDSETDMNAVPVTTACPAARPEQPRPRPASVTVTGRAAGGLSGPGPAATATHGLSEAQAGAYN